MRTKWVALAIIIATFALGDAQAKACSWNAPGANRYTGNVPDAVAAYTDIPAETRIKLRERMQRHDYDEAVAIRRDSITSLARTYEPELRQMHFGSKGQVCDTVDRSAWSADAVERALVYCVDGECVAVPSVCGNVSRVRRVTTATLSGDPLPVVAGLASAPFETLAMPAAPPEKVLQGPPGGAPPHSSPPTYFGPPAGGYGPPPPIFVPGPPGGYVPPPVDIRPPVPEPSTWLLMGLGFLGLAIWNRRRVRRPFIKETA